MLITIDKRGIIQTDDGFETARLECHAPMIMTRDVIYSSGSRITFDGSTRDSVTIIAGPGISVTTGSTYGDVIVGLMDAGASSTVWRDVLSGSRDGVNRTFSLSQAPNPPESVLLFRNGLALSLNDDFTLYGSTVVFAVGNEPISGSQLWARYQAAI